MRKFYIMAALLLAALWSGDAWASVNFTATFDPSLLTTEVATTDSGEYVVVRYEGLYNQGEVGAPSLPVQLFHVLVPYNATAIRVTCTPSACDCTYLEFPVYPEQRPVTTDALPDTITFTTPDPAYYTLWTPLPAEVSNYVEDGFMFSENHIVTVAVSPVQYVPATGELTFYDNIDVTLDFVQTPVSTLLGSSPRRIAAPTNEYTELAMFSGSSKSATRRAEESSSVSSLIVNPEDLGDYLPTDTITLGDDPNTELAGVPYYEYCVVAPDSLVPAFERLIAWKRQKGYTAGVVSIDSILNSPYFTCDPVNSSITDDAARLRAYLKYAYSRPNRGTRYVLLAGDYTNMPIRYGSDRDYPTANYQLVPSDVYFADLDSDWDSYSNGHYGGPSDEIDFFVELCVGRLLCRTIEEVKNYTDKLIIYETNPGKGNSEYLTRAYCTLADSDSRLNNPSYYNMEGSYKSYIREPLSSVYSVTERFASDSIFYGSDVIDDLNRNRYGIMLFNGHGSPGEIQVNLYSSDHYMQIVAQEHFALFGHGNDGSGIDNLTNFTSPAISYSMACNTMPYDILTDIYGYVFSEDVVPVNFGRSFTSFGNYGGIAFLGNTRVGYIFDSSIMEAGFFQEIRRGNTRISWAESLSKINFVNYLPSSMSRGNDYRHIRLTHSLLGCPEVSVWTCAPTRIIPPLISLTDSRLQINNIVGEDVTVSVNYCNGEQKSFTSVSGNVAIDGLGSNPVITILDTNNYPLFTSSKFQNEVVTHDNYLFVDRAYFGASVDISRTTGNFVLSSSKFTLEALGQVSITDGFIATQGSHVLIKSSGTVNISGGIIEQGSSLSIEAPEINILKNFEVSNDSQITLMYK